MTTIHSRAKTQVHDADAESASTQRSVTYAAAENGSASLKLHIEHAIARQAQAWGIRPDQAQVLLLDRRVPA